ncbi:uncharacterized protein N7483_003385 [Penicillium malachiteum]|uniref:uncharacterized protein n=1 Tax=Penicillium malachiteum TaxID=1324776 RepID=UPI002548CC01|nr:uncharacterized protein N7483_003385 [Penicillium malachiteum]KAJ5728877.1 hypothetical protein N7483_003385 [Penicillium malachiteum]
MAKQDAEHEEDQTRSLSLAMIPEDEPSTAYQVGWRTLMGIFALSFANNCAAVSNTTNTIISFQIKALGDASFASWMANANLLVTLAFGPVFGSLSDRLGKKWFIVIGSLIGVIGSVVSGSANHTAVIVAGNALTGLANAGCIMGVPASQEVTPNKLRPWTMGFSQAMASAITIVGTISAGAFVKFQSWRWSYYFNAFIYGTSFLLVLAFYHPPRPGLRRQLSQRRELFSQVDYPGILLFTGSITSLIIALTWGGSTYAWSSGQVIGTLVAGCVGLVAFGLYEWKFTSRGIFDHRLFHTRNFPILLFVCIVDGMLLLGVNVLYAQQIAGLFTTNAIRIATILTPYLATSAFGCIPAGWIMARTKSYRIMLIAALLWCSLFTGLMALINPQRLSWAYAFSALFGMGTAVTTVIPVVAMGLSVPSFLLGTAGTISISCRALGGIVGITIFTAVYDNKISSAAPRYVGSVLDAAGDGNLISEVMAALGSGSTAALQQIQGLSESLIPKIEAAYLAAETYSWKFVWIAICVVVAVNAAVACSLHSVATKMNDHIESALEISEARDKQLQE